MCTYRITTFKDFTENTHWIMDFRVLSQLKHMIGKCFWPIRLALHLLESGPDCGTIPLDCIQVGEIDSSEVGSSGLSGSRVGPGGLAVKG